MPPGRAAGRVQAVTETFGPAAEIPTMITVETAMAAAASQP